MKTVRNAQRIIFYIITTIGIWSVVMSSEPILGAQGAPMTVGRENPFAKIATPRAIQTPTTILGSSEFGGEAPELLISIVTPRYLDAQALGLAIEGMSSPYGSISVDAKSNSLVICDTEEMLEKILEEVRKADRSPQQMVFFETVSLKFLEAESLVTVLQGMSSPYGSVIANKKTNSLIISDTKENLARILSEIEKADKTPKQIMVEVVIVDVQLSDDTEIGINWDILSNTTYDVAYRQNFTNRLGATPADPVSIGTATAYNTTGMGGDFSVISGTVRNVVSLLQQKRDVEILASPRAMMVSGQSASIKAVEEIPYVEVSDTAAGGAGALTSTSFKEVGITLQVTATVTDSNNIFLTLDTEQSVKTGESATGVPVVDTRRADTSLMLLDGQLVVMGGLRRQEKTKQVDQIPILGDLPLIGFMFRYTNTVVNNTELVVFISPHIYEEGEQIPKAAMSKYREITEKPMLSLPTKGNREDADKNSLERSGKLNDEEDEGVPEEVLPNSTEFEEIIGQEMPETLNSSEESLTKGK
ncbi:MAG: secretin N-terminal domain-containing protein [Planctomycetota bacterium]|jgi:type II secretory pathway component GspD/PulD (secretin)